MRVSFLIPGAFAAALAGCSPVNAKAVDPKNDFHCAGLALGFQGLAAHSNAPLYQQRAAAGIADWYWAKNQTYRRAIGDEAFTTEMAALAKVIDADPEAAKSAMMACTTRAVDDPRFNEFAARYQVQATPKAAR